MMACVTLNSADSRPKQSLIEEAAANRKARENSILFTVVQVDPPGAEELVGEGHLENLMSYSSRTMLLAKELV